MSTNYANKNKSRVSLKVLYPELSYHITGLLFETHNILGRFSREKQYGDMLETLFKRNGLLYEREKPLSVELIENKLTNIADFVIDNKILLELKVKPLIGREDYGQIHRYLDASNLKLGIIVNFRNKYLKPIRVIRSNS